MNAFDAAEHRYNQAKLLNIVSGQSLFPFEHKTWLDQIYSAGASLSYQRQAIAALEHTHLALLTYRLLK